MNCKLLNEIRGLLYGITDELIDFGGVLNEFIGFGDGTNVSWAECNKFVGPIIGISDALNEDELIY